MHTDDHTDLLLNNPLIRCCQRRAVLQKELTFYCDQAFLLYLFAVNDFAI